MKQVKNSDDARTAYKKRQDNIAEYIQRIQQKLAVLQEDLTKKEQLVNEKSEEYQALSVELAAHHRLLG